MNPHCFRDQSFTDGYDNWDQSNTFNPSISSSTGQTRLSAGSSLQATSLQPGGDAATTSNQGSSQFGPVSSFTQVRHEPATRTTPGWRSDGETSSVPSGQPPCQTSSSSNAPQSHKGPDTHDNASGVVGSEYATTRRKGLAPSAPRVTHRGRAQTWHYSRDKRRGGKGDETVRRGHEGPLGHQGDDLALVVPMEQAIGSYSHVAPFDEITELSGSYWNSSQGTEAAKSKMSESIHDTPATTATRKAKPKVEALVVSLNCRSCATSCSSEHHQNLNQEWFELLASVASKRAKGTKGTKPPNNNDWLLLEHVARRIQHWFKEETVALRLSVFVVLLKREYRHHLAKCQHRCEHIVNPLQINLNVHKSTLAQYAESSSLAKRPLVVQFPGVRKILENEPVEI